jgi:hypothetical protein
MSKTKRSSKKASSKSKPRRGRWAAIGAGILILAAAASGGDRDERERAQVTITPRAAVAQESTSRPSRTPTLNRQTEDQVDSTITGTPRANLTSTRFIPSSTFTPQAETFYIAASGGANARECPQRSCQAIEQLTNGDSVEVVGIDENGESVSGSTLWYEIRVTEGTAYVHSSLISKNKPAIVQQPAQRQSNPTVGSTSVPATNPPFSSPVSTAASEVVWSCSGDLYNCSSFNTCDEMWSYWNACPGDPSKLDNNNDGRPCESRC